MTIIILLILAGISIATLTDSGLFEKARLAEQQSKNEQEKEQGILGDYENKIESYLSNNREQVLIDKEEYEQLKTTVANINSGFQSDKGNIKITEKNTEITLKSFTNLTPGLYHITYSQALTLGAAGYITIKSSREGNIAQENAGVMSGYSPIHSVSAIVNITSETDKITLNYWCSETTTADRKYTWQFIRLR